jgi:regulator of protease activity HflC (stomatin/prohibitin superfamily)
MQRKISAKTAEWVAWIALIWSFIVGCIVFVIAYWNRSQATYLEGWHFFAGAFLWLLIWLHIRQNRLAEEEKQELPPSSPAQTTSLFEKEQLDTFSAQARLYFFEKWVVTVATAVIGLILVIGGSLLLYDYFGEGTPALIANAPLAAAFLSGFAFFSLLLAKYALGLAKQNAWKFLKAGGNYLFMNAFCCFLCAVTVAITHLDLHKPEHYLAFFIPLLVFLLGVEMLFNLLLDVYRPRVPGQEPHPPYESRFLELFTTSQGILRTAAHTLDYQFGFKVSETWFYQFMEKTIAPLLLFQLFTLYLLTAIVVVRPENQAVIERFGRPLPQVLEPGLYFKWPWPIDDAYSYPVNRIQTLQLGAKEDEDGEDEADAHDQKSKKTHKSLLHTKSHFHDEYNFLIAYKSSEAVGQGRTVPGNLFAVNVWINYRIKNLFDYMYRHSNPAALVEGIGYRELTQFLVTVPMEHLPDIYRLSNASVLRDRIQQRYDEIHLGVELLLVTVAMVHPPVPVANEFVAVIGAQEEMQTKILQAETYQRQTFALTRAEVTKIKLEAESYQQSQELLSRADAISFVDFNKAYASGGDIYLNRKYLKMLENQLPDKRLYILHANQDKEVTIINLEEQVSSLFQQLDLGAENQ